MKHFLFIAILLLCNTALYSQNATLVKGTVTSLNDSVLPRTDIFLEPLNGGSLFSEQHVKVQPDGNFSITIPQSGLYQVSIQGVLHKSIQFPLWIRQPDTLNISIRLDPKNLDDGKYFGRNEYISWIRATGDFNGYNYDRGIRFERADPKTLKATIKTSLDTVRYQIVGLTSGTVVLPGAEHYELRDGNNYVGVMPVRDDSLVLSYKADSTYFPDKNPYEGYRTTWDPNQSELEFSGPYEDEIHKNLDLQNILPNIFNYKIFESDSLPAERFQIYMDKVDREIIQINIQEMNKIEDQISNHKNSTTSNKYYLQSLYIRYLLLSENFLRSPWANRSAELDKKLQGKVDTNILEASIQVLPPDSPLWSLRTELINIYPDILGYQPNVVSYLESVVLQNSDQSLTGNLLLNLFTWSYDTEGKSEQTKKYYQHILNRFGDEYYARKAREYVQKNQ